MWEYLYKCFTLSILPDDPKVLDSRPMKREINELGVEGWEMVSFIQNGNDLSQFIYWFKRWRAAD